MAQPDQSTGSSPYGKIVREIRIRGLRHTEESVVRNQLVSCVGHRYTEETEREDHRWLSRLKVFTSSSVETEVVGDEVILTIVVQELPGVIPYPILYITEANGASGGLAVRLPSFMHRAILLSSSAKFGGLTEADISLQAPWSFRSREWFRVKYKYRDRINKLGYFRENSHDLDIRVGISPHPDWMLSGKFGYLSIGSDIPGITLTPKNRDNTPALGVMLEYDGRDSGSVPHKGWLGIFDITQNGGFLGGDGDFVTTQIDIRRYQPLAPRHILALFSLTSFQSGAVGQDVPVYREYQIGGTNSIRGWHSDARIGKNQFINTLEYRYEVLPPKAFRVYKLGLYAGMQLVAFADLGTVWSQGPDFTGNMIAGGGFGIHFLVPFVDTVRMDFGFGQAGTGIHPHIHIREKPRYSRNRIR